MTTVTSIAEHTVAPPSAPAPRRVRRGVLSPSPGTLGVAAATGLVLFEALDTLLGAHGLGAALAAGWATLVAPAFLVLVLAAVVCERLWPAEPRPLLSRGHLQDACYLLLYVLAIAPFMTMLSVGGRGDTARPCGLVGGGLDGALATLDRGRRHADGHGLVQLGGPCRRSSRSAPSGASMRCTTPKRS